MSDAPSNTPDLVKGVPLSQLTDGQPLLGRVGDESVLLVRRGEEIFSVSASCTHYGGPLAEGLIVEDTVRCPWHHACFSLRTGESLRPPALNPIACWHVERDGELVRVKQKLPTAPKRHRPRDPLPNAIVIIGGGAAGQCAAETLRDEGYAGSLTVLSADESTPCDRPNLSKDYLAGNAPEEWIPLRDKRYYDEQSIALRVGSRVASIDTAHRTVTSERGETFLYDRLLLAMGAEPVRLNVPGADLSHVRYLRSLADSRAIIARAGKSRRAVVIGASFIGLEVAASLRARDLEVDVVAPESVPMARILGDEMGHFIRSLHEEHGVRFHLGRTATAVDNTHVVLDSGERLPADLVVVGIGVRPATQLAERARLALDRGIAVNEYLETGTPGIFAAGDLARWPDPHTGERIRVEHWVVAQRQGQIAARNMLGQKQRFDAVPFFWSMHYDVSILYVGHAERWDSLEIEGRPEARDCKVGFRKDNRVIAVATIGRDLESLQIERAFEI